MSYELDRRRGGGDGPKAANRTNEIVKASPIVREQASVEIQKIERGEPVDQERLADLSLLDLAVLAFDLQKGVKVDPRQRIVAHQTLLNRIKGEPVKRSEGKVDHSWTFQGPDWWFNRAIEGEAEDADSLPPAA